MSTATPNPGAQHAVPPAPTASPELDRLRDALIARAALPLRRATTLPPALYTDPAWFELERAQVLAAGWMCIAHVSQIREPGSWLAVDLLGEPLLAVRQTDLSIQVLSRVCPHRAADIMHPCFGQPRAGVSRRFSCPYHAWSFGLDGRLRAAPEMQASEGFSTAEWQLARVRTEVWEGFVFVNLDAAAAPLAGQYADLKPIIAPWNLANLEIAIRLEWECEFDWKVMIENWMESYHHLGAHHDTLQLTMPARSTWTEPEHPHFIHAHLPFKPRSAEEVSREIETGQAPPAFRLVPGLRLEQQVEWGLFLGYPGFMFLTMRDRVLWYRLLPLGAGRCRVETMTLVTRDALAAPDFADVVESETRMLSDFHTQDMQVNTAVQRGLSSRHAAAGRLCVLEEPVWLIQRWLAARLQGAYPERATLRGPERVAC